MTQIEGGPPAYSRRSFFSRFLSCSAHIFMTMAAGTSLKRRMFAAVPKGKTVLTEPFGRVEKLADGVWALVSTPLEGHRQTFANGGIIAGREGVMAIEGLYTIEGAAWFSKIARQLTGRRPTHAVVTHYHSDHCSGLAGYQNGNEPLQVISTEITRNLLLEVESRERKRSDSPEKRRKLLLPDTVITDLSKPTEVDLGGRTVRIIAHDGHTRSDLTIELEDPRVVWCGDLVWNGIFPNFVDATPSKFSAECKSLLKDKNTVYVPGHGSIADAQGLKPYVDLLDDVERTVRDALKKGMSIEEVAKSYRVPAELGEWAMFSPSYYGRAFEAWARELKKKRK
jgi:glyoxylase-like metal-dependent hydrolase (beta-lactamase superfamily II)